MLPRQSPDTSRVTTVPTVSMTWNGNRVALGQSRLSRSSASSPQLDYCACYLFNFWDMTRIELSLKYCLYVTKLIGVCSRLPKPLAYSIALFTTISTCVQYQVLRFYRIHLNSQSQRPRVSAQETGPIVVWKTGFQPDSRCSRPPTRSQTRRLQLAVCRKGARQEAFAR